MGVLHVRAAGSCMMHWICCGSRIIIGNKKEGERNISLGLS